MKNLNNTQHDQESDIGLAMVIAAPGQILSQVCYVSIEAFGMYYKFFVYAFLN